MDLLDRLLDHDHWATNQLLQVCSSLPDPALDREFDIGHRTLRGTFEHMIFNIEVWTGLMLRQPPNEPSAKEPIAAIAERFERAHERFAGAARQVRDENRFDATFVDHFGGEMTFGGAIIHVVLHNAEHRSEILHILQRLGVSDLPEIDHGAWDFVRRGLWGTAEKDT